MVTIQNNASPIPDILAPGLDLFAAAWLQEFSKIGGHVIIGDDQRLFFNVPEYHDSPAFSEASHELPESVRDRQTSFNDGHYCGKVRALTGLLSELPCGHQAIRAHMLAHGLNCYAAPERQRGG